MLKDSKKVSLLITSISLIGTFLAYFLAFRTLGERALNNSGDISYLATSISSISGSLMNSFLISLLIALFVCFVINMLYKYATKNLIVIALLLLLINILPILILFIRY